MKFVWDFTHWFVGEGSCPGFSGGRVRRRGLHRDGCWRGSGIPIDVWLCLLFFLPSFIMPLKCCNILIYFEKTPSNNQTGLCNKFCIEKASRWTQIPKERFHLTVGKEFSGTNTYILKQSSLAKTSQCIHFEKIHTCYKKEVQLCVS